MKYDEYNDYELLYLVCDQDENARNIMFDKYRPLIISKVNKISKIGMVKGLDFNDLVQEGMIGLSEAIRDYRDHKDTKFSTFAQLCIERQLGSALRKADRLKNKILNESLSLDYTDDGQTKTFGEYLEDRKDTNPEYHFLNIEYENEIFKKIADRLTDLENRIFELKVKNFTYDEMANILDINKKTIDNAIQRIKLKTKQIIDGEK